MRPVRDRRFSRCSPSVVGVRGRLSAEANEKSAEHWAVGRQRGDEVGATPRIGKRLHSRSTDRRSGERWRGRTNSSTSPAGRTDTGGVQEVSARSMHTGGDSGARRAPESRTPPRRKQSVLSQTSRENGDQRHKHWSGRTISQSRTPSGLSVRCCKNLPPKSKYSQTWV